MRSRNRSDDALQAADSASFLLGWKLLKCRDILKRCKTLVDFRPANFYSQRVWRPVSAVHCMIFQIFGGRKNKKPTGTSQRFPCSHSSVQMMPCPFNTRKICCESRRLHASEVRPAHGRLIRKIRKRFFYDTHSGRRKVYAIAGRPSRQKISQNILPCACLRYCNPGLTSHAWPGYGKFFRQCPR